jgi:hypothetical protein
VDWRSAVGRNSESVLRRTSVEMADYAFAQSALYAANLGLMTGFVCDRGGPIAAQIATAMSMAARNTAPGFPFRTFNSQPGGAFASRQDAPCRAHDKYA